MSCRVMYCCLALFSIASSAVSSEPPGTAKPVPVSEGGAKPALPPGVLAVFNAPQKIETGRTLLLAALSPDGKWLAIGGKDDRVYLFDAATSKEARRFEAFSQVYCLALSPDGKYLATGNDDKTVHLWELATGKERRELTGHLAIVLKIAFSPDGKLLASADGSTTVRIWQVATGKEVASIIGPIGAVMVAFAGDGKVLATAHHDGSIRFHDIASRKELRQVGGPQLGQVVGFAFAADGKTFAAAHGNNRVYLRDTATGRELHQLVRREGQYHTSCLAFSPDGRMLATGASDGYVRVWETASGKQRRQFQWSTYPHIYWVSSVAFAADGRRLLTAQANNVAILWDIYAVGEGKLAKLQPQELAELWTDLSCEVANTAYDAVCRLIAAPAESVPFLQERLRPPAGADANRIEQLIASLDDNRFAVREKAMQDLAKLPAEAALRRALAGKPSLETRRRIEQLLDQYDRAGLSPERLRELRAVEVLERIGTQQARQVLAKLAQGAAEDRLTDEAKLSLGRLEKRAAAKP